MLNRISQDNLKQIIFSQTPIDRVYSIHEDKNFIDVQGSAGGDNCTYRIYDNGMVVEK
jgi:hypothetical protein